MEGVVMWAFFLECDWSCNACTGPLRTDCLQCMDGYVLQDGVCVEQCSPQHYRDSGSCKRKCQPLAFKGPMASFSSGFSTPPGFFPRGCLYFW